MIIRRLSGLFCAVTVHPGSSARLLLEAADPLCSGRIRRAGEATKADATIRYEPF